MTFVTIMCHNDELSSTLNLENQNFFILFAESSHNPSQNFCYSHSLNFHVSGSPESISKQPTQLIGELNSSLQHIIVTFVYLITTIKSPVVVETPVTKAEADNISH